LQARYAGETAITALKIRHNNVIGYYIEVSAGHAGKLGPEFIHRQTMAGAQRYTTAELADLETKIASAAERALALELRLYEDLVGAVMACRGEIAAAATALATLDLAASLAELAVEVQWVRPVVEDGSAFEISGGRHPTVEAALAGAALEHLHEVNRCRTLFATHYHELTALAAKLPALACYTMRVKEWKDDVVFLHEVGPGTADRSYGIHVAKLAGLPKAVTARAE